MSDARNSSGNIRGGGSRLTGGGGRTQKQAGGAGSSKKELLAAGGGAESVDKKTLAKRNLQLKSMSKQLALEARAACLRDHTEAEYAEFNIPIPDPESALRKLKAMTTFTQEWYDEGFRERWLREVLQVWNQELRAEYDAAAAAAARATAATSTVAAEGAAVTTEELEAMLQDAEITGDERKKIKKKLQKRRKQKESKAQQ